jgi:hypothetical protein
MFVITDEFHDETQGEFADPDFALAELRRRAKIPWDREPNLAPCTGWRTCGRRYEIVEYDEPVAPRREVSRVRVLEIDAKGVRWQGDYETRGRS